MFDREVWQNRNQTCVSYADPFGPEFAACSCDDEQETDKGELQDRQQRRHRGTPCKVYKPLRVFNYYSKLKGRYKESILL